MEIKLIDFGAEQLPTYKHDGDAGADVYSTVACKVLPGHRVDIPLNFGLELPNGMAGYIIARGSVGVRGLIPISNPIDSGYRGVVYAKLWNVSDRTQYVEKGERIAQLVIMPYIKAEFAVIKPDEASETDRGTGAYGSTGKE